MQRLPNVPNPVFPSLRDITLYTLSYSRDGPSMRGANLWGSSLKGQRSINDFFHILDHLIEPVNTNDYQLQQLDDEGCPLASPPVKRSSVGNIISGSYLIESAVEGGKIAFKLILTVFDFPVKGTDSPSKRVAKRAKRDEGKSTASEGSSRDPSDHKQGFKMRLLYRDKGCVACLAAGVKQIYECCEDSNRYEGSHVIALAYHELWDAKAFSTRVSDPFTDPANAGDALASPTTRSRKDVRRMNSLENGILLCVQHHSDYDSFLFSIHPDTHKIFSFHPATAMLHGVKVKAPWDCQDAFYPPPHPTFLEMHYFSSISKAMKGSGEDYELDDEDEDDEELASPEEVRNNQVRMAG